MSLSLVSGRVLRTREKSPAAIVRWDLMRPVGALPAPSVQVKRVKAVGCTAVVMQATVPASPNPIPEGIRRVVPAVIRMVAEVTGASTDAMLGPARHAGLVRARQIAFYLARNTGASLPSIGRDFGGKDHTTVLHGTKRVEAAITALSIDTTVSAPIMAAELWRRRAEWPKWA